MGRDFAFVSGPRRSAALHLDVRLPTGSAPVPPAPELENSTAWRDYLTASEGVLDGAVALLTCLLSAASVINFSKKLKRYSRRQWFMNMCTSFPPYKCNARAANAAAYGHLTQSDNESSVSNELQSTTTTTKRLRIRHGLKRVLLRGSRCTAFHQQHQPCRWCCRACLGSGADPHGPIGHSCTRCSRWASWRPHAWRATRWPLWCAPALSAATKRSRTRRRTWTSSGSATSRTQTCANCSRRWRSRDTHCPHSCTSRASRLPAVPLLRRDMRLLRRRESEEPMWPFPFPFPMQMPAGVGERAPSKLALGPGGLGADRRRRLQRLSYNIRASPALNDLGGGEGSRGYWEVSVPARRVRRSGLPPAPSSAAPTSRRHRRERLGEHREPSPDASSMAPPAMAFRPRAQFLAQPPTLV